MGPMMQFNTNMLEAAMLSNVEWYIYIQVQLAVYEPAEVLFEDDVWNSQPSKMIGMRWAEFQKWGELQ